MSSLCVHSTPKHMRLREGSISVLQNYKINIDTPVTETESFQRIVYLPKNNVSGDYTIGKIFFIQRSKNENLCNSLSASEAVQLLIQNLLSPDVDMSACLQCAIKLAPKCRQLIYSDMSYVRDIIENE